MNAMVPAASSGGNSMIPTDMGAALRLAEMMATGRLVPAHLQKSPGDCLMVFELAMRFRMSPFAVAQCTSVIQGKLMLEGKLVAAAINSSGVLDGRLDYEFSGVNDTRAVTVKGTMRGETSPREMTVGLKEAKTSNALWTKQPDQQLVYFATRAWARRHAPEVMLGVYSPEEFDAQTTRDTFTGTTLDAVVPHDPAPASKAIGATDTPDQREAKQTAWMDKLELELAHAVTEGAEAVDAIVSKLDQNGARDRARGLAKDRIEGMIADAYAQTSGTATTAPNDEAEPLFANPADDPFAERVPA